jgi:hypothetical protein
VLRSAGLVLFGYSCWLQDLRLLIDAALTHVRLEIAYYIMVLPRGGIQTKVDCDSKAAPQRVHDLEYDGFGTAWRCQANYDIKLAIWTMTLTWIEHSLDLNKRARTPAKGARKLHFGGKIERSSGRPSNNRQRQS